jgi:protein gp37
VNKTSIQWSQWTTQLVRFRDVVSGDVLNHCEKVSPGCRLCYAERITRRWKGRNRAFTPAGGEGLEAFVDMKNLREVAHTRRSGMVFVEDMSDLFGDWVTDAMLDQCFGAFALSGLTIQFLTKRARRMREYLTADGVRERVTRAARALAGLDVDVVDGLVAADLVDADFVAWPLPNVWGGVSVENQQYADERVPDLIESPLAYRFVSYEPALGPVDFDGESHTGPGWLRGYHAEPVHVCGGDEITCRVRCPEAEQTANHHVDWINARNGGLLIFQHDGEDLAVALLNPRLNVLLVLNVLPSHRRHGLGQAVIEYCRPTWVRALEAAEPWFKARGFVPIGAKKQGRSLRTQVMVKQELLKLAGRVSRVLGEKKPPAGG